MLTPDQQRQRGFKLTASMAAVDRPLRLGLTTPAHAAKALLIAIMSALACATSSIADTATDVELYAAYCMGVHAFEKEYFQDKHLAEAERAAGMRCVETAFMRRCAAPSK